MPSRSTHQRGFAAQKAGHFGEIVPLVRRRRQGYTRGRRRAPRFQHGAAWPSSSPSSTASTATITPGNSSQVTDGAAWLLLASRRRSMNRHKLTPIGRIVDTQWAGLDPAQMGLGPVHAATPILQRHGLGLNDLDAWEINEAFAAQVMGCIKAWEERTTAGRSSASPGALGTLDAAKLNVDGGAIALGHPVGASGARIVLHLLHVLRREAAARHRHHLHRRRPGRRDAGGGLAMSYRNWKLERDARRRWHRLGHPRYRRFLDQHPGCGSHAPNWS
jgi:acetyl-CoA C-acetyltransferase